MDPTNEILKEAAGLLKSLRGIKAVKLKSVDEGRFGDPGQYALLDGGATNGLRMARAEEIPHMEPTTVELAHGTTTLYRMPGHHTLLSKTAVEPIIPNQLGSRPVCHPTSRSRPIAMYSEVRLSSDAARSRTAAVG